MSSRFLYNHLLLFLSGLISISACSSPIMPNEGKNAVSNGGSIADSISSTTVPSDSLNVSEEEDTSIVIINDTTSYSTGEIFATIRCKAVDENGRVVYNTDSSCFQGYFIVTNNNDSMLSFNLANFLDTSIQNQKAEGYTHLGERWGRPPVLIPFEFTYHFVDEKDSVYVHIMPWVEWSDEWQYGNDVLDALRKRQAIIIPHI